MKTILLLGVSLSMSYVFGQSIQTGSTLEHDFSNATLTAKNVDAFESRARQKVRDFCNYIQLVSDKSYDEKLREHSKNTAMNLFNSSICTVSDSLITGSQKATSVEDYFDILLKTEYQRVVGEANDILLAEDLVVTESGTYVGLISYTQSLKCFDSLDELVESTNEQKNVMVMLTRKTKAFGDTEKVIWVVELCDIESK